MITQNLLQGTPEWAAHRAQHDNASDAPAMMGCSPYKTRSQLLHERHTGLTADVDSATQRRFDDGHRFEALARPLAEAIVGQDLYPVTGSNGRLSASFDGLVMDEAIAFEHKFLNSELRGLLPAPEMVSHEPCNAIIPLHYRVQMQQQCMVSGASSVLFMATKWDGETLVEARHCWYESDSELADAIRAGWEQFHRDLAEYVPPEAAPAVIATAVTALPAVSVNISGEIVVKDNFKAFETALRDFIEHRLILKPETDQEFADLDLQIKALKGAEAMLDSAEVQMLSQVEAVDLAKRTKDMLHKLTRDNRLMAEKLLASRKEQIKGEIVAAGIADLRAHIDGLNTSLGKPYMPTIPADFAGAAKNKRTVDSLREAVNNELTRVKIESSAIADKIQINLATLREFGKDHVFLFADTAQIVLKAPDDLTMLVKSRIAVHQQAEEKRLEFEREKIRAEEQAKAEKDARDRLAREAEEQRLANEATARATAAAELTAAKASPEDAELSPIAQTLNDQDGADRFSAAHPSAASYPNVVQMRQPVQAAHPALKLGEINARLAPIQLSADGLRALGFEPAATDRASKLYHEASFTHICAALVKHINSIQATQAA